MANHIELRLDHRPCSNGRTGDGRRRARSPNSAGHTAYVPVVDDSLEGASGAGLGKQLSLKVDGGVGIVLYTDHDAI